jgi:hypothetical protein
LGEAERSASRPDDVGDVHGGMVMVETGISNMPVSTYRLTKEA